MEFLLSIPLWVIIITMLSGVALLILECFLPGLGAPGITGFCLVTLSLLALFPRMGDYILLIILALFILILALIWFFVQSARRGKNPLILNAATSKQEGFSANDEDPSLVGQKGVTVSFLRPSGIAEIAGKRVDVVTNGEFVEKDEAIEVSAVEGRRIIVKKS